MDVSDAYFLPRRDIARYIPLLNSQFEPNVPSDPDLSNADLRGKIAGVF
jgi:hypothetical protein